MKSYIRYTLPAIVAAIAIGNTVTFAEDKPASKGVDPKMEEMMKKAEAAGAVGAAHKALAPLAGEWTAEVKSWMTPGAPPMVSKGTAKATWVMDGRYLQEDFHGDFMGKPFHGMSLMGYDNMTKKYNSVWIDNMSTIMVKTEGEAASGGKVLTLAGEYACPMTGDMHKPTKQVVHIVSDDKHVFEMHDPSKGENSKEMEITYTRK